MGQIKRNTPTVELCRFFPKNFINYFEYVNSLIFDE